MSSETNTCKCGEMPFMDSEPLRIFCKGKMIGAMSNSGPVCSHWVECENCDRASSIETSKQAAVDDWNNK